MRLRKPVLVAPPSLFVPSLKSDVLSPTLLGRLTEAALAAAADGSDVRFGGRDMEAPRRSLVWVPPYILLRQRASFAKDYRIVLLSSVKFVPPLTKNIN